MPKQHFDGYLREIQEQMDVDVFKSMLEIMAPEVMEEEITRHLATLGTRGDSSCGVLSDRVPIS